MLGAASGTSYVSVLMQLDPTASFHSAAFTLDGTSGNSIIRIEKPFNETSRLTLWDDRAPNFFGTLVTGVDVAAEHLFVFRLELGGGTTAGTSRVSLFLDPRLDATAPPPTATLDNLTAFPVTGLSFVTSSSSPLRFDEVRVGSSFADVMPFTTVPEPATTALASAVLLLGGALWHRSRR